MKGKINNQADALSRLNTTAKTIVHDGSDDIPDFSLDPVQMKDETKNSMDFKKLQYSEQDAILSAYETENDTQFDPIELDEVIHKQLTDPFCVELRRKLNDGGYRPSRSTTKEFFSEAVKKESRLLRPIP